MSHDLRAPARPRRARLRLSILRRLVAPPVESPSSRLPRRLR